MQILKMLLNNCRESDRQIGKTIGISGGAINARIKKMHKSGVIEHYALKIQPPVLGYEIFYIVTTGTDVNEILKQVRLVGNPFLVVPCVGGITVCGIVVKENVKEKIELARNLMKGVRVLSIFESQTQDANPVLTKTDLVIIKELMKNPRERLDGVAAATGLSTKTIARSIEKLQNDEVVQFTLVYDPAKISDFIPYVILTWILGDIDRTLRKLNGRFADSFLQLPFLAKDQIVLFMYSDNIYKLDDITQRVRSVPGVSSTDLFIPKKITLPKEWIHQAIKDAKEFPAFHLPHMKQTN